MNRHFYNFVAVFNWSAKTNRRIFFITMRNKQILAVLDLLCKEGVIAGYELPKVRFFNSHYQEIFSSKKNNYYTPVKIFLKNGPVPIIKTIGSPGKRISYNWKKLERVSKKFSSSSVFIVSSSYLGKMCNAVELRGLRQGATPLFIVTFVGDANI